jgi:hypothetical protein
MDETTASLIIAAVWTVGLAVWMVSLMRVFAARRAGDSARPVVLVPPTRFRGEASAVQREVGRALADTAPVVFGVTVSATPLGHDVEFSTAGTGPGSAGLGGVRGRFRIAAAGKEEVDVSCEVDFAEVDRRAARWTLTMVVGVGAPVVFLLPLLLMKFVAGSESAAVRGQALQVLQMVHVLWPPFLILYLLRQRPRRFAQALARSVVEKLRWR